LTKWGTIRPICQRLLPPEKGPQRLNRLSSWPAAGAKADIVAVETQLLDDLLHIFELPGRQAGVAQQPVARLSVLVPDTEQVHRIFHKLFDFKLVFRYRQTPSHIDRSTLKNKTEKDKERIEEVSIRSLSLQYHVYQSCLGSVRRNTD